MKTDRKSFILHRDSLNVLDELDNNQAGLLFKAIKAYQNNEDIELDSITKIVMSPFKSQFERDEEKYNKIVERNKNNGLKGGRPRTQGNPKKPSGLSGLKKEPKKADSVSKSDSDSDSDKEKKKTLCADGDKEKKSTVQESFEYWWKLYPKKVSKAEALAKWKVHTKKMSDDEVTKLTNVIANDIEHRMADLATGSKKFIGFNNLHGSRYIKNMRWKDEY